MQKLLVSLFAHALILFLFGQGISQYHAADEDIRRTLEIAGNTSVVVHDSTRFCKAHLFA